MKLDINEVAFLHASVSEKNIKGSEASFVAKLLTKLVQEVDKLQPPVPGGALIPPSSKKSK